ncbi:hypothetical protein RRG08_021794 [Elysia crispata]|uniref:Uncharacterized protein n=1 Tax=Elysia crispata TaxID=231223 RepID=A0AAE0ZXT5_9GAST|nr:hypothetical protein RRG08_021794 [Elysia crispata]
MAVLVGWISVDVDNLISLLSLLCRHSSSISLLSLMGCWPEVDGLSEQEGIGRCVLVVDGGFNCDGGLGHDACSNIEYMHVSVVQGNYGTKLGRSEPTCQLSDGLPAGLGTHVRRIAIPRAAARADPRQQSFRMLTQIAAALRGAHRVA